MNLFIIVAVLSFLHDFVVVVVVVVFVCFLFSFFSFWCPHS